MTSEEILKQIKEWVESSHSYLSRRTDYARGYSDGITKAKEIILEFLRNEGKEKLDTR